MISAIEQDKENTTSGTTPITKKLVVLDFHEEVEPLLVPNNKRFVLFPIQYNNIWKAYKNAEAKFWSAEEIELGHDSEKFKSLAGKEKSFCTTLVALYALNDAFVNGNLVGKISDEIQVPEARCFFGFMGMQRNIHDELFTVILDLFTSDYSDKDAIVESTGKLTCLSVRKAWIESNITDTTDSFGMRVMAVGIYYYMLHKGLMDVFMHLLKDDVKRIPGLFKSVSKVSRDFNSYSHFMDIISSHLLKKPSQLQALKMVQEIIKIESLVVEDVFGLMGSSLTLGGVPVDVSLVKERLKWHGDNCLLNLGYSPVFNTKDPLPWIEPILKREAALEDGEHTLTRVIATPKKTPKKSMESELFKLDEDF